MQKKYTYNKYETTNGKKHFSGVINYDSNQAVNIFDPKHAESLKLEAEKAKILEFDISTIKTAPKPKEINKYLFSIMQTATNNENTFIK
jgi:hypothetical protein